MATSRSLNRSRSLGGCTTCRRRHRKCDESRPSCTTCKEHATICEGYEIRLLFDVSDDNTSRCRRPLFTMEVRQKMSERLIASTRPKDLDRCLADVEETCGPAEYWIDSDFMFERGPFGAFRVSDNTHPNRDPGIMFAPPDAFSRAEIVPEEPIPNDSRTASLDRICEDPLMEFLFWDIELPFDDQHDGFLNTDISPLTNWDDTGSALGPSLGSLSVVSPSSPSLAPEKASFLLSLYREKVSRFFSPVSANKTPWKILHIPIAMEAFAELTMGEIANPARMCIFYSILSTVAFMVPQLSSDDTSSNWKNESEGFLGQAQSYLTTALRELSSPQKKIKYKDMLIAFLCMGTAWIGEKAIRNRTFENKVVFSDRVISCRHVMATKSALNAAF
ncbi:hypothetical protein PENSTE_c006G00607 [Penicillium steckii]|uniref:Zn(2)-C6 fungal-type domain-containing protein n=1 Tax=Penicillium steckii TaxID=303698 RepID=A0A1V6THK3_9EURO|nr:hypothetical protein PENSTE_c006G00607 [Penicillium steckii]